MKDATYMGISGLELSVMLDIAYTVSQYRFWFVNRTVGLLTLTLVAIVKKDILPLRLLNEN